MQILSKRVVAAAVSFAASFLSLPREAPAALPSIGQYNRLAAQTWRTVDDLFYDRTFNGQDWLQMRKDVVKRKYASEQEAYSALDAMVAKLGDKYTRFLTPAQYSAIMNSATGELVGIGVELSNSADANALGVLIPNVEESSPAQEAGLKAGDLLVNVDGTSVLGKSAEETALLVRGKEGTKANVRLLRAGASLDYSVARRPLRLKGVTESRVRVKGKDVLVLTVRSFTSTTSAEMQAALEKAHDSQKQVDAIVLNLRNNGGGLLQGAVEASNLYMPPGKIVVFVVNKEGQSKAERTLPGTLVSSDPSLPDLTTPLFVLVNKNTASAAEVLAGALSENDRARLVGEQTFGKGIIQTLVEVGSTGSGVAVTIAKYETPNHNNINKVLVLLPCCLLCLVTAVLSERVAGGDCPQLR